MTISQNTLVAEIAAQVPSSVRVFERHGVDFCCGGKKPIAVACDERGLSFADVAREIEESAATNNDVDRDWTIAPLRTLADHIVSVYHDALRHKLPRLEEMAAKVVRVHGTKAPRLLARIEAILGELSADLNEHMRKEEQILFPAIRNLERAGVSGMSISYPIRVMELEHDRAGELLEELRQLTEGFVPPVWACATARALYHGLAELEAEMHVHVHLENNVLFPRALALADQTLGTGA